MSSVYIKNLERRSRAGYLLIFLVLQAGVSMTRKQTLAVALPGDDAGAALDPGEVQAELLAMLQRNAGPRDYDQMLAQVEGRVQDATERVLLVGSIRAAVAISEQQSLQQRRERGLMVVLETAHDLTAIRDLELVLEAIVRRARQIFTADIGYLTHFDRVHNDFYIRAAEGAISERFKKVRVPPDHGICGYILKHKAPYHCSDYPSDLGFAHDQGIDQAIREEGVQSLLGAPLMVGNHCIGVLCICDRQSRHHAPWEIAMLSTLAAQAAIAIENARLFQEAQVALQRASEANASLHHQAAEIEAAAEAHEGMTKLVARGCTVLDLLSMVAGLLNGHVTLLNEAEQPLQLTEGGKIDGRVGPRLAEALQQTSIQDEVHRSLTASRRTGRSQEVDCGPELHVRGVALMGADRLLGAMLIALERPMTPTQIRTFERGALMAGVVLLSQERSERVVSNESASAIRALVSWQQESLSGLQVRTKPLGLDLSAPLRMALLSVEERNIEYALRRVRPRLASGTLLEEFEGFIVAICAADAFEPLERALREALVADERLQTLGVMSAALAKVDGLPGCFRSLKRGIDILRALGRSQELVAEATLSMYALLFEQAQVADVSGFIEATVGPLAAYDSRRNTDLAGTLLAFLEHAQNAKATADDLQIHVNTLRQRLDTVDSLLDGWRQGGRALELHVALRLHMLRRRLHGSMTAAVPKDAPGTEPGASG
jgi:sugar diacid utilization regulator